jgi:hypothetical protein
MTFSEVKVYGCNSSSIISNEMLSITKENPIAFNQDQVTLFPNPAENFVNLRFNSQNYLLREISILDIYGRVVTDNIKIQNNIPISNLNNGTYFVKIVLENTIIIKKFIKNSKN